MSNETDEWAYAFKLESGDITGPFEDLALVRKALGIKECMKCYFEDSTFLSYQIEGLEAPLRWLFLPRPECDQGKMVVTLTQLNKGKHINIIPSSYVKLCEDGSDVLLIVIGQCQFYLKTSDYVTLSTDYQATLLALLDSKTAEHAKLTKAITSQYLERAEPEAIQERYKAIADLERTIEMLESISFESEKKNRAMKLFRECA